MNLYCDPRLRGLLGSLHPGGTGLTAELVDRSGLAANSRVLDVGFGPDATSTRLLAQRFDMHGVDTDPEAIRQARACAPEARLDHITDLDGLGRYDGVLSECTLCLMGEGAARRLADRLRPGGVLMLSDVTVEADAPPMTGLAAAIACLQGAGPHAALVASIEEAGLVVGWADNRPALLGAMRDRIRKRIDVDGLARMLGLTGLVAEAEAAYAAGHVGYAVLVATKPLTDAADGGVRPRSASMP